MIVDVTILHDHRGVLGRGEGVLHERERSLPRRDQSRDARQHDGYLFTEDVQHFHGLSKFEGTTLFLNDQIAISRKVILDTQNRLLLLHVCTTGLA